MRFGVKVESGLLIGYGCQKQPVKTGTVSVLLENLAVGNGYGIEFESEYRIKKGVSFPVQRFKTVGVILGDLNGLRPSGFEEVHYQSR